MEENKNIKEKLTYEQLETLTNQLTVKCNELYTALQEANISNTIRRLKYLFKVIEYSSSFPKEFTQCCINEVVEIMTLPKEEPKTEENVTE